MPDSELGRKTKNVVFMGILGSLVGQQTYDLVVHCHTQWRLHYYIVIS